MLISIISLCFLLFSHLLCGDDQKDKLFTGSEYNGIRKDR